MTEKFQAKSKICAKNRSCSKVKHCMGSKSFLRYREEMQNSEFGRIEFYKLTRCKKDVWTSTRAKENHMRMIELKNKPVIEGSAAQTEDEICEQVLGTTPGYVNGLGNGERCKSLSNTRNNTRALLEEASKRAELAEKKNKELVEEVHTETLTRKTDRLEGWIASIASHLGNIGPLETFETAMYKRTMSMQLL